jgi:hypothetical protein
MGKNSRICLNYDTSEMGPVGATSSQARAWNRGSRERQCHSKGGTCRSAVTLFYLAIFALAQLVFGARIAQQSAPSKGAHLWMPFFSQTLAQKVGHSSFIFYDE